MSSRMSNQLRFGVHGRLTLLLVCDGMDTGKSRAPLGRLYAWFRCLHSLSKYLLTLTPDAYATLVIMLLLHMVTMSCSLLAYHPRVSLCGNVELSGLGGLSE